MPSGVSIKQVTAGNFRAVARVLSRVENRRGQGTFDLLRRLHSKGGNAQTVGVTGPPGAGKSTLVDALIIHYRKLAKRVGIIAVDPSSPFSGGAVLGDRVRMQQHAGDPGVFIRSMASRGRLGGLSPAVHDSLVVLDAARFDILIVETVGVGQGETDVAGVVQATVVVLVPGTGDEVQTMKAGLLEIGDIFVINKAERPEAAQARTQLESLVAATQRQDGWRPPVIETTAVEGRGVSELAEALESCLEHHSTPEAQGRRLQLHRGRLLDLLRERLTLRILDRISRDRIDGLAEQMMTRRTDPYTIVDLLIQEGLEAPKDD